MEGATSGAQVRTSYSLPLTKNFSDGQKHFVGRNRNFRRVVFAISCTFHCVLTLECKSTIHATELCVPILLNLFAFRYKGVSNPPGTRSCVQCSSFLFVDLLGGPVDITIWCIALVLWWLHESGFLPSVNDCHRHFHGAGACVLRAAKISDDAGAVRAHCEPLRVSAHQLQPTGCASALDSLLQSSHCAFSNSF